MKMNRTFSMKKLLGISLMLICVQSSISFASVDEIGGGPYDTGGPFDPRNPAGVASPSREVRNEIVLYQRLEDRKLNTEQGIVVLAPDVAIVDSRPVDEWYEKRNAKVTFVFANKKMIRVEIRN